MIQENILHESSIHILENLKTKLSTINNEGHKIPAIYVFSSLLIGAHNLSFAIDSNLKQREKAILESESRVK